MDLLSPRTLAIFVAVWLTTALLVLFIWWALDENRRLGGATISDPQSEATFIFCSRCGFYPSDTDDRVGVLSEQHAENLATLHRASNPGHETFLIPGEWVSDTPNTHVQEKFR